MNHLDQLEQACAFIVNSMPPELRVLVPQSQPLVARDQKPCIDLFESETGVSIYIDAPGVTKESISVTVDGPNVLTVSFERVAESVALPAGTASVNERRFGKYLRKIQIPFLLVPTNVSAKHENGVLLISVVKPSAPAACKIQIS